MTKNNKDFIDFYDIRDEIIPNGQNILFKKYIDENSLKTYDIETFYGVAVFHSNHIAISLINLYVRENDIKIDKTNVLRSIYWAECRDFGSRRKNCCISYCEFDNEIEYKYRCAYKDIFNK